MSYEIVVVDITKGRPQLAGKAFGDHVFEEVVAPAAASRRSNSVLVLSLRGAEFVTGSFLKAIWLRLHPDNDTAVPAVVAHLGDDVRTEFDIFLRGHRLLGVEALDWTESAISRARCHGQIEDAAWSALRALVARPGSTAPELCATSAEQVSPTAWTNRLNELHHQGLVLRERAGRAWRFFPIAQEVERG
ncbi:MAG: hypothetical protein WDO69_33830 [Pseudomonadota bacterium]